MLLPLTLVFALAGGPIAGPRADPAADLAEGDAHHSLRSEGASGGVARPEEIDRAIAAYRRALAADPSSLEARAKLLRALFFRASFCGASREEKKRLFEDARGLGEDGVGSLELRIGGAQGPARVQALRRIPGAAAVYFWTAVAWGEWALARGKLAAARQGAAGRIRDLAQTLIDLDPDLEQGGGYRILGRLHDQSPRIPFLTGWVSRDAALENLRQALARGPRNTVNQVFLAEAILDHAPSRREEALRLLQGCAAAVPRPEYPVEDAYYADLARKLLAERR